MRIVDLLKKQSIDLNAAVADKTAAIGHLVDLMDAGGNLDDKELYKERVLAREAEGSTGIGEGVPSSCQDGSRKRTGAGLDDRS